jgi:hypothetical protein
VSFFIASLIVVLLVKSPILVEMAPNGPADPGVIDFGMTGDQFLYKKIVLVTTGSKANKYINCFYCYIFRIFSGVKRHGCR